MRICKYSLLYSFSVLLAGSTFLTSLGMQQDLRVWYPFAPDPQNIQIPEGPFMQLPGELWRDIFFPFHKNEVDPAIVLPAVVPLWGVNKNIQQFLETSGYTKKDMVHHFRRRLRYTDEKLLPLVGNHRLKKRGEQLRELVKNYGECKGNNGEKIENFCNVLDFILRRKTTEEQSVILNYTWGEDNNGIYSPLGYALQEKYWDVSLLLLKRGALPDQGAINEDDYVGLTELGIAVRRLLSDQQSYAHPFKDDTQEILSAVGDYCNEHDKWDDPALAKWMQNNDLVFYQDSNGSKTFMSRSLDKIVRTLIKKGSDITKCSLQNNLILNRYEKTLPTINFTKRYPESSDEKYRSDRKIHLELFRNSKDSFLMMRHHLNTLQCDPLLRSYKNGQSILQHYFCSSKGHYDSQLIASMIDKYGINPNIPDYTGKTILHYAVSSLDTNLLKILLAKERKIPINVSVKDKWENTPLSCALFNHYPEGIKLLLQAGADPEITQNNGLFGRLLERYTDCWSNKKVYESVKIFFEEMSKGYSTKEIAKVINEPYVNYFLYNMPLVQKAIIYHNYDLLKLLLDYGANPNTILNENKTLLGEAIQLQKNDMIDLLLENGAQVTNKELEQVTSYLKNPDLQYQEIFRPIFKKIARYMNPEKFNEYCRDSAVLYNREYPTMIKFFFKILSEECKTEADQKIKEKKIILVNQPPSGEESTTVKEVLNPSVDSSDVNLLPVNTTLNPNTVNIPQTFSFFTGIRYLIGNLFGLQVTATSLHSEPIIPIPTAPVEPSNNPSISYSFFLSNKIKNTFSWFKGLFF